MKRLKAAFIFVIILVFTVIAGNHFIKTFNQTVLSQLVEIKSASYKENYDHAIENIKVMQQFYHDKKPVLSLFVYHEQLNDLALSMQSLKSYALMRDQQSLISEVVKSRALLKVINESASRLF